MRKIDSETIALPVVGQGKENQQESVTVSLTEMQRGREVRAVHHRGDERLGSYSFRIVDEALQECEYRSAEKPPIEVVQAVEQYGYHVNDAGSRPKEAVDLQHVDRILEIISNIYLKSSNPLLKGFLSHAQDSLAAGVVELDFRATIIENHDRRAFDDVMAKMWERISNEYEDEEVLLKLSEIHDNLTAVATDGGYVLPNEFDIEESWTVNKIASRDGFFDRHVTDITVHLTSTEDGGNRKLLATVFDRNHVNRYTFDVRDSNEGICVVQGDGSEGRPPMEVIDEINAAGYEITNMNVPHPDEPLWKQFADAYCLLEDINQSYEEENIPYENLDRAKNVIQDAVVVAMNQEVMEWKEYVSTLMKAVHTSSLVKSIDGLESYSSFTALDDFLWSHYPEFIPPSAKRKLKQMNEEYDIF